MQRCLFICAALYWMGRMDCRQYIFNCLSRTVRIRLICSIVLLCCRPAAMDDRMAMLPDDLPEDMPSFLARFGTDEQCREYLLKARWPDGSRCSACGHGDAYALRTKIVYECAACRKQHSLLAGTIFEQTKTGLSRWFLAVYLVTSSKGGIAAAELKRQLGLGSYQTAWTWLHKLRKAMVRPDRQPLAGRVEVDETYVGGPRSGRPGRGAAGKAAVAGAVEAGRGKARG